MTGTAARSRVLVSAALVFGFSLFVITTLPSNVAAQSLPAAVQTGQLLPPGQNTCQAVTVTSIKPHVYDGTLESFDVTISDTSNSYVGILAQVGNTPIPLDFITRWAGVPSGLMIHVDTINTNVAGGVPVQLTLLSSPPGAPTCITTVSFDVSGYGLAQQPAGQSEEVGSASPVYPSYSTTPQTSPSNANSGSYNAGAQSHKGSSGSSLSNSATSSMLGATTSPAGDMGIGGSICAGSNAYRLWFILLLIYVVIVAIVVFAEPWFLETSVVGSTAAILVPLILLLAFWYISEACRAASWIPVVACVIAIVGLFLAFREYELPPLLPAPEQ